MKLNITIILLLISSLSFADADTDYLDNAIKALKEQQSRMEESEGATGLKKLSLDIEFSERRTKRIYTENEQSLKPSAYGKCLTKLAIINNAPGIGKHSRFNDDFTFSGTKMSKKGFYHFTRHGLCFVELSKKNPAVTQFQQKGRTYILRRTVGHYRFGKATQFEDSVREQANSHKATCENSSFSNDVEQQLISHIMSNLSEISPTSSKVENEDKMLLLGQCRAVAKASNNSKLLGSIERKLESIPGYQDLRKVDKEVKAKRAAASQSSGNDISNR